MRMRDRIPHKRTKTRKHNRSLIPRAPPRPPRLANSMKPLDGVLRILDWCDAQDIPKIIVTNAPRIDGK